MQNNLNYTCLFGGGGARGFAYCGTIKALEELGVNVEMTGGSSVGSIFAALLAAGYTSVEMKDIFMKVNFDLFRDIHFGLGKDFALSKGDIFTDWVRELLQAKVWADKPEYLKKPVTFKDIETPLVIITTNLSNFKCQEFSKFTTPDYDVAQAVRISCSMPGLMTPFNYEDDIKLVDGDLQKSMPMWQLSDTIKKKSGRVIEFRLEGDYSGEEKNAVDFLNTIYSCMTYVSTEFVSGIFRKNDRYECIKINTRDTIIVDFNMSKEARNDLYGMGYDDTMNYFKNFLPLKKRFLLEKYKTLFILFKEIETSIKAGNVNKTKILFGSLFMELADCRDNIDDSIYKDCLELKKHLKPSLKQNLFFGETFGGTDALKNTVRNLISASADKIKDIETYIHNNIN